MGYVKDLAGHRPEAQKLVESVFVKALEEGDDETRALLMHNALKSLILQFRGVTQAEMSDDITLPGQKYYPYNRYIEGGKLRIDLNKGYDGDLFALRFLTQVHNKAVNNPQDFRPDLLIQICKSDIKQIEELLRDSSNPLRVGKGKAELLSMSSLLNRWMDERLSYQNSVNDIDKSINVTVADYRTVPDSVLEALDLPPSSRGIGSPQDLAKEIAVTLAFEGAKLAVGVLDEKRAERRAAEERERQKSDKYLELQQSFDAKNSELSKEQISLAQAIASRNAWKPGSFGYDFTKTDQELITRFSKSGNYTRDYLEMLKRHERRRPLDPFVKLDLAMGYATAYFPPHEMKDYYNSLCHGAALSLEAASLFPSKLQQLRSICLVVCVELLNRAASTQARLKGVGRFTSGSGDSSPHMAIVACNAILKDVPADTDGSIRMEKAIALCMAGQTEDAIALMVQVRDIRKKLKCPRFAYAYAAMRSSTGEEETALWWLRFGFEECGLKDNHFTAASSDEDFVRIRKNRNDDFTGLKKFIR